MEFEQRFKASGTGYCTVEDGIIYEFNPLLNGSKNRVGVTDAVYNELKAISDEYYKKLVELGAITPPKTPEQIQQETMELMSGMLTEIKAMKQEMELMKNERSNVGSDVRNGQCKGTEAGRGMENSSAGGTGDKYSVRSSKGC